jgi:hypothetical protein
VWLSRKEKKMENEGIQRLLGAYVSEGKNVLVQGPMKRERRKKSI